MRLDSWLCDILHVWLRDILHIWLRNILHTGFRRRFCAKFYDGWRSGAGRFDGGSWPVLLRQLNCRTEAIVYGVAQLGRVCRRLAGWELLGQLLQKRTAFAAVYRAAPAQVDDSGVVAADSRVNVLARCILVLHSIARWRLQHTHQGQRG